MYVLTIDCVCQYLRTELLYKLFLDPCARSRVQNAIWLFKQRLQRHTGTHFTCTFPPFHSFGDSKTCGFQIDLRNANDPISLEHRKVLSAEAADLLRIHDDNPPHERNDWPAYKRAWRSRFEREMRSLDGYEYHPVTRAIAEIVREHWIWHLWERGLVPLERSAVSRQFCLLFSLRI